MNTQDQKEKYLALTIGPVVKTLLQARKTRELWASSYLLSHLMQLIMQELDPNGTNILIPKVPSSVLQQALFGAGIFPDRLFMRAGSLDQKAVDQAIESAITKLIGDCTKPSANINTNDALKFWKAFLRIRYVILPLAAISNGKLSLDLSPYLESMELEDTCIFQISSGSEDYLEEVYKYIFDIPLSNRLKMGKGNYQHILKWAFFPSTMDVATYELFEQHSAELSALRKEKYNEIEENNEVFYQEIAAHDVLRRSFKPRHKYFCIVQADGDGIGELIKKLNNVSDYQAFSEKLAEFGAKAAGIINDYGGKPIYIGGDDLLFLTPLRSKKGSVWELIRALDAAFKAFPALNTATLSFGVNVVYYKFPLFEAIGDAYGILKRAKEYKSNNTKKNAVSFQFTKHSGNAFAAVFSKSYLDQLIKAQTVFEASNPSGREGLVSSLIYKLNTLERLLLELAKSVQEANPVNFKVKFKERLMATLDHYFAEWKKHPDFEDQKREVGNLLLAAAEELGVNSGSKGSRKPIFTTPGRDLSALGEQQSWLDLAYTNLRLLDFMTNSPKNNKADDQKSLTQAAG